MESGQNICNMGNFNNNYNQISFNQMQCQMNPMMMQNQMNLMMMQNQMNQMINNEINDYKYEDVYDYIKEYKIKIIFKRVIDDKLIYIKIPRSLRKNELYFTANKYKYFHFSDIQLFHKDIFLNEDETSIDCINENDEIKIIEQLHGVDFSYYDLYLSKHKNENKLRIFFEFNDGLKKILSITRNTSIEEMIKILFNSTNIPQSKGENLYTILYNSCKISLQDKSTLNDNNILDGAVFLVILKETLSHKIMKGKTIEVYIKENNELIYKTIAGTLQTIKSFNHYIPIHFPEIKRIVNINGKIYDKNDERTFSSIGIRDNFTCNVELNNK